MNQLGNRGFEIFNQLSSKPRAGWIRREVGIPLVLCESVLEHSLNVERACRSLVIGGYNKIDNKGGFSDMGKYHDLLEYDMPDITPHCGISDEEKLKMELSVLSNVKNILGVEGKNILDLIIEYLEQKTNDSNLLLLLDKVDAGVKAFEYEKLGFIKQVSHFHNVIEKLNGNDILYNIYQILLEREFSSLNYHFQYFRLLQLLGNYEEFKYEMKQLINTYKRNN